MSSSTGGSAVKSPTGNTARSPIPKKGGELSSSAKSSSSNNGSKKIIITHTTSVKSPGLVKKITSVATAPSTSPSVSSGIGSTKNNVQSPNKQPSSASATARSPAASSAASAGPASSKKMKPQQSGASTSSETNKIDAAALKRKIADLVAEEAELNSEVVKMKKERTLKEQRLQKLLEAEGAIKFPVKDELIQQIDKNGPPVKPLPCAILQLSQLFPEDVVDDAVGVWDFINNFCKQLSITTISLEDFADLMRFSGRPSVALTDIFCALLKIILSDSATLSKINAALPREVHYARRHVSKNSESALDIMALAAGEVEVDFDPNDLIQQDDFDLKFNGLKLLPRRLRADAADGLRWQAVLRCVLLRLEPARQLRRALVDAAAALHFTYHCSDGPEEDSEYLIRDVACSSAGASAGRLQGESSAWGKKVVDAEELVHLVGLSSAFKRRRAATPKVAVKADVEGEGEGEGERMDVVTSTCYPATPAHRVKTEDEDGDEAGEVEADFASERLPSTLPLSAMKHINTFKVATGKGSGASATSSNSSHHHHYGKSKYAGGGLDKDAIFNLTGDVSGALSRVYDAAAELEELEMHQLSATHKIAVLKVLCDACYETQRMRELLERNAEERAVQIQQFNKQQREQKAKQREIAQAKKEAAIQACRKINKLKAEAAQAAKNAKSNKAVGKNGKAGSAASVTAADGKSTGTVSKKAAKSKSKPKGKAASEEKNTSAGTSKSKSGGKDVFDPTPDQLNAMIEELVMLETLGIDTVEELPDDEDSDIEDEDPEAGGGDGDEADDDEDEEFVYDARGNLIVRERRPRRVTAEMRAQANERKRLRVERQQRRLHRDIALQRLEKVLASNSRSERDIKAALRGGVNVGLQWENDDGEILCTPLMKEVYKLQYDQNMRAKEDRASSQHERTLQEHFVRTSPLGSDRRGALYWAFAGDERLFVQEKVPLAPGEVKGPRPPRAALSKLDAPSAQPTVEERDAQVLWRLYERRPHRFRYRWSVYCGGLDQWQLWDALDDRGEKERELRARLKARFDIEEPQQQYEIEGSDFVGRKVRRVFGKRKPVVGLIVGWLPSTEEDPTPLWHVQHLDGDEEDLDEAEVRECLVPEHGIDDSTLRGDIKAAEAAEAKAAEEAAKAAAEVAAKAAKAAAEAEALRLKQEEEERAAAEARRLVEERARRVAARAEARRRAQEGQEEEKGSQEEVNRTADESAGDDSQADQSGAEERQDETEGQDGQQEMDVDVAVDCLKSTHASADDKGKERGPGDRLSGASGATTTCTDATEAIELADAADTDAGASRKRSAGVASVAEDSDDVEAEFDENASENAGTDTGADGDSAQQQQCSKRQKSSSGPAEDEPRIVTLNNGLGRGTPIWRAPPLSNQVGPAAAKSEMLRLLGLLSDALKHHGSSSGGGGASAVREWRRAWESGVRAADDVDALVAQLLDLESTVRGMQQAEDRRDKEEEERVLAAERQEMIEEGWLFQEAHSNQEQDQKQQSEAQHAGEESGEKMMTEDGAEGDNANGEGKGKAKGKGKDDAPKTTAGPELIGRSARRFFRGFGSSDGVIVAHLPAAKNEGIALFHMRHSDGDAEDLDEADVQRALRAFDLDLKEDDDPDAGDGDDDSDDEDEDEEEEEEDSDSDFGGDAGRRVAGGVAGAVAADATLWPTYEVRCRWREAVSASRTLGEVCLALGRFADHAKAFGALAEDPFEVERREREALSARAGRGQGGRGGRGGGASGAGPCTGTGTGRNRKQTERYVDSLMLGSSPHRARHHRKSHYGSSGGGGGSYRPQRAAARNISYAE